MVLSNTSQECTCTFELTDVHQCIKVDFPCCCFMCLITTSFHSFSTAAFASGINIARSGRSFAHTLERQISRIVWTIRNSRFPNIHTLFVCTPPAFVCTPEIRWVEQHPEFVLVSSQVHTWEYLVLPGFGGYSKNFAPQIRHVARRETTCANFHLKRKKENEELSFRSFHWNEFVYQVVILHWIPYFSCNINTNEFWLQTLRLFVISEQRFPVCMFAFSISCQYVMPHMTWTWCRLNFHQSLPSTPGWLYPSERVSFNNINLVKSYPWCW